MKSEPKYKLGELVIIRILKITMEVIITKRIVKGDYDKGEYEFLYDFKHTADIKDAWNWTDVDEESLHKMIHQAERYEKEVG